MKQGIMLKGNVLLNLIFLIVVGIGISCSNSDNVRLPIIGNHSFNHKDTVYHEISKFMLLDQDSNFISNQMLSKGIYVADFFYSYCPTICPKVKNQMLRIHDKFGEEHRLKIVSFALDPERDNVANLKTYSQNLDIDNNQWYFLTGDKGKIWDLAEEYLISVRKDPDEPGGIFHSGKIILIDQNGHIRSFANGTSKKEVDRFMVDIEKLLRE